MKFYKESILIVRVLTKKAKKKLFKGSLAKKSDFFFFFFAKNQKNVKNMKLIKKVRKLFFNTCIWMTLEFF